MERVSRKNVLGDAGVGFYNNGICRRLLFVGVCENLGKILLINNRYNILKSA